MHPSLCISLIETLLCFIDEKCVFELDILWFVCDFDPFIIFKMQHIFLITAKDIKSNLLFYSGWKSLKFDFFTFFETLNGSVFLSSLTLHSYSLLIFPEDAKAITGYLLGHPPWNELKWLLRALQNQGLFIPITKLYTFSQFFKIKLSSVSWLKYFCDCCSASSSKLLCSFHRSFTATTQENNLMGHNLK